MYVNELLAQLEDCNEDATISCIMQSAKNGYLYSTVAIGTSEEEELIDIIVMDINDKGITIRELKNDLSSYNSSLPVCIKENKLTPYRYPYQVNGIKCEGEEAFLEIPYQMSNLS